MTIDKFVVVTGADRNFYSLLTDLLDSIRDAVNPPPPIAVFDFGLDEDQRRALEARGHAVKMAEAHFDGREHKTWAGNVRALTVRPFIPQYFPGYDVYLWIDGDAWVQDASAIDVYVSVAREGKLAITPHIGRCYKSFNKWQRPRFNTLMFREYRKGWGWRVANQLGRFPIANAGVFALKGTAPHWELWRRAMEGRPTPMWDQTALNYVIHYDRAPTGLLPDLYNWICIDAPPKIDEATGTLVEPEPPYQPIKIIHLVGQAKTLQFNLQTLQGRSVECSLRYSAWIGRKRLAEELVRGEAVRP